MTRQRVAVLDRVGHVRTEEREVPEPGVGQVLVRVAAVGVCGSDVHYYEHGRIGDFVVDSPLVLGHEASGTVVRLGPEVLGPEVGQRVALEPQSTCDRCEQCARGRYNLCPNVVFFATPPVDGAFAEYVVVDARRAHPVPDGLSDEAAALIEPLAVAVHATAKARVEPGQSVLVSGAGPVGLLCAQVALARGAGRVTVTDVNEHRLRVAARLGAHQVLNVAEEPDADVAPAEVVLECSGAARAVEWSVRRAAPAGTVVLVGMGATVTLPLDLIQARELWITGTFRYAHAYPAAIALASSGAVELDDLVTGRFDLDGVEDALLSARRDPTALKSVVSPGGLSRASAPTTSDRAGEQA
ncbi:MULTISPECIES: alcohol dehydrogenase catalytic domain-containing protein [Actinoalloteichus]|uniref:L-iditol 2-dehydrogenase n=1 Tax=Actinoalloteichus caeruleus DSM 43889 TaxID=1120930 RepID=A0ABT1JL59_ACTCY|nr:NAD(P)-dependent alcohol dehydrogenase [Actinoalloteichus caeruleus]MCP2333245.1 L-iditol 2-dehydrogenase [Actinoalloteichus caeruleus DSM 43889]